MGSTHSTFSAQDNQQLHGQAPAGMPPMLLTAPSSDSEDRSGQVLNCRYRLNRMLEKSQSLCQLYEAEDLLRQTICSVKMVRPSADPNLSPQRRFLREVEILSRLSHPNIVSVLEFNHDENRTPYLVLEALSGSSLRSLLIESGPLSLSRALPILRAIASALQHLHDQGIVHGNLKLASIFLQASADPSATWTLEPVVKLLDFELARDLGASQPSGATVITKELIIGTPAYLAPEALASDRSRVDAYSDQWAMGIIAYRLLSGRLPFASRNPARLCALIREREAEPLEQHMPQLPTYVSRAIHTALSKNKSSRHATVTDFARALDALPPLGLHAPMLGEKTVHGFRADLIALCRDPSALEEAVPMVIEGETSTCRYPAESFARQVMSSEQPDSGDAQGAQDPEEANRQWLRIYRYWLLSTAAVLFVLSMALAVNNKPWQAFHGSVQSVAVKTSRPGLRTALPELCLGDTIDSAESVPLMFTESREMESSLAAVPVAGLPTAMKSRLPASSLARLAARGQTPKPTPSESASSALLNNIPEPAPLHVEIVD